jgi:NAD(P)-dependent dehydrogenase (short-subunit alcohol dehydrogenase family)
MRNARRPLNPADRNAKSMAKFGGDTPMKRPAQPEEIAPAFVFLAAPSCSSYITGEIWWLFRGLERATHGEETQRGRGRQK